jgi:hypothetical protein
MSVMLRRIAVPIVTFALLAGACGDDDSASWHVVHDELPGALLSVWGTTADDVWAVGADPADGSGPTVMHFDGAAWETLPTGEVGDLWWVHGFQDGPIFMGGAGGMILRYDRATDAFTRMTTPGTDAIFGIWGSSPTDVWAVGGAIGGASGAFAWKLDGDSWVPADGFPDTLAGTDAMWKVWGRGAGDVWIVGTGGKVVHWDGAAFALADTMTGESLFTVHADAERFVTVGGYGTGLILEHDGTAWQDVSPEGASSVIGVHLTGDGDGWAVGQFGAVYRRGSGGWTEETTGFILNGVQSFHSVWVDPDGGVWAVGGEVTVFPLRNGVMVYRGDTIPGGER